VPVVAAAEARGCDKGRRTFSGFKILATAAQPIAGCASGYKEFRGKSSRLTRPVSASKTFKVNDASRHRVNSQVRGSKASSMQLREAKHSGPLSDDTGPVVAAAEARGCDKGRRTFSGFKILATAAQPIAGCARGYKEFRGKSSRLTRPVSASKTFKVNDASRHRVNSQVRGSKASSMQLREAKHSGPLSDDTGPVVAAAEARGCDKGRRTFSGFKILATAAQPIAGCASGYKEFRGKSSRLTRPTVLLCSS